MITSESAREEGPFEHICRTIAMQWHKGSYDIIIPDKIYCPSGVKAASIVKCGEGSRLNPHFYNIQKKKKIKQWVQGSNIVRVKK